jgi:hypothetical protein
MPTKRIFEVALVAAILVHPAMGLVRLWAAKTLGTQPDGTFASNVAKTITVLN